MSSCVLWPLQALLAVNVRVLLDAYVLFVLAPLHGDIRVTLASEVIYKHECIFTLTTVFFTYGILRRPCAKSVAANSQAATHK